MIAIMDYGIGNLGSVLNAFKSQKIDAKITSDPDEILSADKVILPGVGAFGDAVTTFKKKGFEEVLKKLIEMNKPVLGICVGMQILFEYSTEFGKFDGLKLLKGHFIKFESEKGNEKYKVPHMGWNNLSVKDKKDPLFGSLDNKFVYFVHSYYLVDADEKDAICTTEYAGEKFVCAVRHNNIFATQFHPEKSGEVGLAFLKRFAEL